jgi:hypothetical protein
MIQANSLSALMARMGDECLLDSPANLRGGANRHGLHVVANAGFK